MTGKVDHGEEKVAHLLLPFRLGSGRPHFAQLLLDLVDDAAQVGPIEPRAGGAFLELFGTEQRSEEHTSEIQSLMRISYAVLCLNKKNRERYHKSTHITISTNSITH